MKYIGIDYGSKNIGLASSDTDGALAFPHKVIPNDSKALAYVAQLIMDNPIEGIAMGDTHAGAGAENKITPAARKFAESLEKKTGMIVEFVPESWSSFEAARYAPTDNHDDSVAAAIILQRYIDMRGGSGRDSGDGYSDDQFEEYDI